MFSVTGWSPCQHLHATWVADFSPARGIGKFFSTHLCRVPTITEKPVVAMVNGDVMETAVDASRYLVRWASGLL
jgi:hypothetical protein